MVGLTNELFGRIMDEEVERMREAQLAELDRATETWAILDRQVEAARERGDTTVTFDIHVAHRATAAEQFVREIDAIIEKQRDGTLSTYTQEEGNQDDSD